MRIAIVGLSIEIMLASPVPTGSDAIQLFSPAEMRDGELWMIRGAMARIRQDADVEAVPLCWATALPGGPVTGDAYAAVKQRTLAALREQGPFDGVLVVNHGALEVDGLAIDADTDFVVAIRALIGPAVPIALALDLHGDMTPELLAASTVISVLRTAPHRDDRQTGFRAADQLIRVIRTGVTPKRAAVRIPMLIPGETAVTSSPPADDLYGGLPALDAIPGVLEANILVGFAWNDRPWTGATAIVLSERDAEQARREALGLAARIWARRHDFSLRMETAEVADGLRLAASSAVRPVYVSDSGDNTTAGAPGDLTEVLQAALDVPELDDAVVAGITAPRLVRRLLDAGIGSTVEIDLGLEHRSRPVRPRRVTAIVEAGGETLDLAGFQPYRSKEAAWARVRVGGIVATFHARAIGVTTPEHLRAMGIHPTDHRVYVLKLGYLHPSLEDVAGRHILLLSDGTAQLNMNRLHWDLVRRPIHPLDADIDWSPETGLYGDEA
jgi:microcystin degradation protein MlrC